MHRRSALKRLLALAAVFALALGFFTPAASADAPAAAPLTAGSGRNGMVRVRLSSLGSPAVLNLTVYGSYTVNGQSEKQIVSGSKVTVRYDKASGALSLTSGGVTANMGSAFKLRRHAADGQNGVKIAQGRVPGNLYPGDFLFTVRNGTYYIIMRRKKIRQKNKTRNQNSLLDELLSEVFKYAEGDTTYKEMEQSIPDSLDIIGIDSEEYLRMIKDDLFSQLNLKEVKLIKRYGE